MADLNGDGRQDAFIACHGYDASPFPGERNQVVLSQSSGPYAYRVANAGDDIGFFHGGALFDFDADGATDALVVNSTAWTPLQVMVASTIDGVPVITTPQLPAAFSVPR